MGLASLLAVLALGAPAFGQLRCSDGMEPLDRAADSRLSAMDFVREVAAREIAAARAFSSFAYAVEIVVQTLEGDRVDGELRQVVSYAFDERGLRKESVSVPVNTLSRLKISDRELAVFREALPFVFTSSSVPDRDIIYIGRQRTGEFNASVFDIVPRSDQAEERGFVGRVWVRARDSAIVKTCGRAGIFPLVPMRFEGLRTQVAGEFYLPAYIRADDVVRLKDDSHVHVRVMAQYSDYKAKP